MFLPNEHKSLILALPEQAGLLTLWSRGLKPPGSGGKLKVSIDRYLQ
jgi:hypothetical protein